MTAADTATDEAAAQECAALAAGLTIPSLLHRNAEQFRDLPALSDSARTLTWFGLRAEVAVVARGLADLGLAAGERMLIMMSSRWQHWVVDLAAVHLSAIPCTAYQTLSTEQIGYVAKHSGATVVVLEGADELARWAPVLAELPALHTVIVVDNVPRSSLPELRADQRIVPWSRVRETGFRLHQAEPTVFENLWPGTSPDEPVAMMYTSGTTGDPKAVVLSHYNAIYEAVVVDVLVPTPMHSKSIAYLPLAHVAERELGIYRALYKALHVTVCPDPSQVVPALGAVSPPSFFGVPRVWEKVAGGLQAVIGNLEEPKRTAVQAAMATATEVFALRSSGQPVPEELAAKHAEIDAQVLAPIRGLLGMAGLTWASSGSAPLPLPVLEFLASVGIEVLEVWGMSETTGCATVNTPEAFKPGTVGRAVPGVDIRLAEDGEIFVRGPIVFLGYLDEHGAVVPATDADGWLATGDIGTLDEDGYLTITDRKKELIITSSGKNVAPTKIEGLLRAHPLVGHAAAIGDRRPYLTALITLDEEGAPAWAAARGISGDLAELSRHPEVVSELDSLVEKVNGSLARAEQIKKYQLLPQPWTADSGELTPTLKLRRRIVSDRYAADIESLYS
jgi:long-chain acyl-CoA synthetase